MGTQAMEVPSQVVQRLSIRWLPDEPFEDTATVALNVGGYFIDLRVTIADQSIQWSQAGERIILKQDPCKSATQSYRNSDSWSRTSC